MSDETGLYDKMIARADADKLPSDHELRVKALAFNNAAKSYYIDASCDVKTFMGHWARARRVWCDYSGEPLI